MVGFTCDRVLLGFLGFLLFMVIYYRGCVASLCGGRDSGGVGASRYRPDFSRLGPKVEGCGFFRLRERSCELDSFAVSIPLITLSMDSIARSCSLLDPKNDLVMSFALDYELF